MSTFTWVGSRGSTKTITFRTLESQFADGYRQAIPDGINSIGRSWPMVFANRDQTEADDIEAFLLATKGVTAFDWTDFDGHAGKWVVKGLSRNPTTGPFSTITCTFVEVFGA